MKKIYISLLLLLLFTNIFSQSKDKKYFFNGYLSQMNQMIIDSLNGNWINDGQITNRLVFNYYGIKNLTFDIEVRNRFLYGETIKYTPNYGDYIGDDRGILDLSFNIADKNSFVLNSNIDRLYLQYEIGSFKTTLGRQRINWGKTFVWNSNDWFNNYSFFDFDYAEKSGVDAIDFQLFMKKNSNLEFAAKANADTNFTYALKFGFNLLKYDFQILTGIIDDNEFASGFGWSGNISQITFRGEGTYLQPLKNFADTIGVFIGSVGFDYMFQNGLVFFAEFLYNQSAENQNITNIFAIQTAPKNIKSLSFAKYNAVVSVAYPINPIINISMAYMYMSLNNWMFFSPNISFALSQNLDFTLVGQFFTGKIQNPITQLNEQRLISILFFRFKYSF